MTIPSIVINSTATETEPTVFNLHFQNIFTMNSHNLTCQMINRIDLEVLI